MRLARRVLATTLATLALAAGGVVVAGPAAASPEDGKGCVGTPSVPDSYICVISTTPANVLPTTTTTPINVTVPKVCYFADCTAAQTVAVPVPGATPGSGQVAVLWYKGQYLPIAVGTGTVLKAITDVVNLATTTLYGTVLPAVNNVVDMLPTTSELIAAVNSYITYVMQTLYPYEQLVLDYYQAIIDIYNDPYQVIYNLPYYDNLARLINRYYCDIQEVLDPYYYCYY